jgi:phosphoribosylanthranilate isomerase
MLPKVKICCISSIIEAKRAIEHGAAALGLVGPMPSGPGIITNETIAAITATLPPAISSFLLTSETVASNIIQHHQLVHTNTIQMFKQWLFSNTMQTLN